VLVAAVMSLVDGRHRFGGFCVGDGARGRLGNGLEYISNVPVAVTGLSGVEDGSVGAFDSMALLENGTVETWGENSYGQLGNGTTTDSNVPVSGSVKPVIDALFSAFCAQQEANSDSKDRRPLFLATQEQGVAA
jgi:alpha-tubulin suppressor-like RCC1 family protein